MATISESLAFDRGVRLVLEIVLLEKADAVIGFQADPELQARIEELARKDGSTKKESRTADQLDAHGNWTKLTRWQTDSQGTRPLSVAYRTLTYY